MLLEQGYTLTKIIFYQDNENVTKMESNGRKSAGDRSRHMSHFDQRCIEKGQYRIETWSYRKDDY